ncbi:MAG: metal-dependent hydrolase [Chloroflexia bacterium]|nr:metal-dependent hydrolase [Chloroflexia bacterium]
MAQITWLGHASFQLELAGQTLLIDPFIEGNPACPLGGVDDAGPADLVLVTHAHGDHGLNEAIAICKRDGAKLVSFFDLIQEAVERGLPSDLGVGGNIGGTMPLGLLAVKLTQAFHTIPIVGMVISGEDRRIYHSSDTGLFGDMALIGRPGLDLALLPIGDYFTMGIDDAVQAVELLRPKAVIPMHYNTFPPIAADPQSFAQKVGGRARVIVLQPGESATI